MISKQERLHIRNGNRFCTCRSPRIILTCFLHTCFGVPIVELATGPGLRIAEVKAFVNHWSPVQTSKWWIYFSKGVRKLMGRDPVKEMSLVRGMASWPPMPSHCVASVS